MTSRRDILKSLAAAPAISAFSFASLGQCLAASQQEIILKTIPSTGELIPAVGMGSYQTFNVSSDVARLKNMHNVLQAFLTLGGRMIDSSPMYGSSEAVIGHLLSKFNPRPEIFAASKVWTYGKQAGIDAIVESREKMQVEKLDLMQVHNLRDWQVQLNTLDDFKAKGKIRYTGITTSRISQYDDFEQIMRRREIDFIQVNYNIKVREAEKRLLPLAQEKGIAVIVNMPFEKGRLFKLVKKHALPEWAKAIGCYSWGQFFLKFILSHPAVTCAIPATSQVVHVKDNMQAMIGDLPDRKIRQRMLNYFESL